MHPVPCSHCGNNFMRPTIDPEAPKLCNNCSVREEKRNPKKVDKMTKIGILIQCPQDVHVEIEELCINRGIDLTKYFLDLHHASQLNRKEHEEKGGKWEEENELPATSTTGMPDKFFKAKSPGKKK